MLSGFYKPRWMQFFAYAERQRKQHKVFDQKEFEKNIKEWEWRWVSGQEPYADTAAGDPVKTARMLYAKYAGRIKAAYNVPGVIK